MIKKTIKHMAMKAKMKLAQISVEMGKHPNFLATTLSKNSIPRLDTFLEIARVTGYSVVLVGHNEEITMVVPDDDEEEVVAISSADL